MKLQAFARWLEALKDHRQFRQQQLRSDRSAQMTSPAPAPEVNEMNPTGLQTSTTIVNAESLMPSEGSLIPGSEMSPANMLTENSPALVQLNDNLLSAQKGIENLTERAGVCTDSCLTVEFIRGARDLILLLMECVRTLNHERKQLKPVMETATSASSISPQADGADTGESFK